MEWNIRKGFPFPEASIDAIDMTLSMHYVTQYASDIADLFGHVRNVLKNRHDTPSPSTLCEALLNLGFKIDEMRYTPNSLFVNILAIK